MTDFIESRRASNVLHVELTRVDKYNALTDAMYVALKRVFAEAMANDEVHVVLFNMQDIAGKVGADEISHDGFRLRVAARITTAGAFCQCGWLPLRGFAGQ